MSDKTPDGPDDRWLEVLAGRGGAVGTSGEELQAAALRKALQARTGRLDAEVPDADPTLFEQIRFRLRREGLDSKRRLWRQPAIWGIAASLMLGVAMVIRLLGPEVGDDGRDTLRGGGDAAVLIVQDVEARLVELRSQLQSAGVEPVVRRLKDGRILLQVQATPAVLDLLSAQRIEVVAKDGVITLVLVRPAKP